MGPPTKFEASKLKVVLLEDQINKYASITPRTYILSHCDLTANLTLAVSNVIKLEQVCVFSSHCIFWTRQMLMSALRVLVKETKNRKYLMKTKVFITLKKHILFKCMFGLLFRACKTEFGSEVTICCFKKSYFGKSIWIYIGKSELKFTTEIQT